MPPLTGDRESQTPRRRQIFPPWVDDLTRLLGQFGAIVTVYVVVIIAYGFSPDTTDVGYMPQQPVPYSHKVHAGKLGIDCRYCHTTVESTARALIPPTQTCMNCHATVHPDRETVTPLVQSYSSGMPVEWIRVHDLADFVYFNHSAHVSRGVGCVSCHGRVDVMEEVYQVESLSMDWCLGCHRNPAPHLRPFDKVTDLTWKPSDDDSFDAKRIMQERDLIDTNGKPTARMRRMEDCSTCHR